ncbi:MAG: hypothetical protein DRO36_01440 [Candidatus Hecatellales archaeon]|nr:MAG: hypothetical protein DRO36_01440 [Candidatus Hecatellales archaeon]
MLAGKLRFSIIFLVVGLFIGLTVGYSFGSQTQLVWKEKYFELQKTYGKLEESYKNLNLAYSNLKSQMAGWKEKYVRLQEAYKNLNLSYLNLKNLTTVRIELLEDKEYYPEACRLISHANKSIQIIMYVVKYDSKHEKDPVNVLLKGLVEAKKRGVEVKVLVDDVTLKSYPQTIKFLSENKIPVRLDPSRWVTTHTKMVIVDGKYLLVGSHNWTESALTRNHEVTVKIYSEKFAGEALKYFDSLWDYGRKVLG